MKRLILFIIALNSVALFGQNKKLSELPTRSTLNGTEYVYCIYAGTSYKIQSSEWLAAISDTADLLRSAYNDSLSDIRTDMNAISAGEYWNVYDIGSFYYLYPKIGTSYPGIYIGGTPTVSNSAGLYVGASKQTWFTGDVYALEELHFTTTPVFGAHSMIKDTLTGELLFVDKYNRVLLSDLNSLPTSLSANWTLDANTYDVSILDDNSNGFTTDYATGITTVRAAGDINMTADEVNADTITVSKVKASDLCLSGDCIDAWADVGGGGGIGGTHDPNILTSDTLFIALRDTANSKYAYQAVIQDSKVTTMYDTVYSISSANILAGDSILLLPAPGANKFIDIQRITVWWDYNSVAYTSGGSGALLKTFTFADVAVNIGEIDDDIFTLVTSDGIYPSIINTGNVNLTTSARGANKAVWLDIDNYDTGNSTFKILLHYSISDFN